MNNFLLIFFTYLYMIDLFYGTYLSHAIPRAMVDWFYDGTRIPRHEKNSLAVIVLLLSYIPCYIMNCVEMDTCSRHHDKEHQPCHRDY